MSRRKRNQAQLGYPDRRRLVRLDGHHTTGLSVVLLTANSRVKARVTNYHTEGMLLQIEIGETRALMTAPQICLECYYGDKRLFIIDDAPIGRFDAATGECVVLFGKVKTSKRKRTVERLRLKSGFPIICLARDPIRGLDFVHLEVLDINGIGMLVKTSLSNKHIMVGMTFRNVQLMFSGVGLFVASFEIVRFVSSSGDQLEFGCRFLNPSTAFLQAISQYAIFGVEKTGQRDRQDRLRFLQDADLPINKIKNSIRYCIYSDPSDYRAILELRYRSYKRAKKLSEKTTVIEMADDFDNRSLLLMAKLDGVVIGTARLVHCESDTDRFPFESVITEFKVDSIKRGQFVEVSKLAIDPEYQGTDVVLGFFSFIYELTGKSRKVGIFCFATESLLPLYKKVGAQLLCRGARHPVTGEEMALLEIIIENVSSARNIPALSWLLVIKDISESLYSNGFIKSRPNALRVRLQAMLERTFLRFTKARKKSKRPPKNQSPSQK